MKARNQEIVMPKKSRIMTQEEMEYEGGLFNLGMAAVLSGVSLFCDLAVSTGLIKGNVAKAATAISYGCTIGATVCSFGGATALAAGSKAVAKRLIGKTTSEAKAALGFHTNLCLTGYQTGLVASGKTDYGAGSAVGFMSSVM